MATVSLERMLKTVDLDTGETILRPFTEEENAAQDAAEAGPQP